MTGQADLGGGSGASGRGGKTLAVIGAVLIVVAIAVVALVVFGRGAVPSLSSKPNVDITAVNVDLTGASCSGDASSFSEPGGNVSAGATFTFDVRLVNTAPTSGYCTFSTPSTSTTGFSVSSSNAPLTVYNGGSGVLDVSFDTPAGQWTGVLSVSFTVTTG